MEFIEDNSLFWALRGGGAGPWGAVTHMTIKLHKPRNDCQKNCYHVHNAAWGSNFFEDMGSLAVSMTQDFFSWVSGVSDIWSGYFMLVPGEDGNYYISFGELMYSGDESDPDASSLFDFFQ